MQDFLFDSLKHLKEYNELLEDIRQGLSPLSTYGIVDENLGHIVYALKEHLDKKVLLITYDEKRARTIYDEIKNLGNQNIELFTKKETLFYDIAAFSHENSKQRLNIISKLLGEDNFITITSMEALADKIMSKDIFVSYIRKIEYGKDIELRSLIADLIVAGYERVQMVEGVGQFSLRGGIVDIFPPNSTNPFRIELFDQEVDSIRSFDLTTQRSIESLDQVSIVPTEEIILTGEYRSKLIDKLKKELARFNKHEKTREKFSKYIEILEEGGQINNRDMLIPFISHEYLSTILEYFDDDSLVFLDEPRRIENNFKKSQENMNFKYADLLELGEILPSHFDMSYNYKHLLDKAKKKKLVANSSLLKGDRNLLPKKLYNFSVKPTVNYYNKLENLSEDLKYYQYRGYKIVILSGTEDRGLRLQNTLQEFGISTSYFRNREETIKSGQIFITASSIQKGFEYPTIKLIIISDKEIFGSQKQKTLKAKKKSRQKIVSLSDLEIGSYIVHENHGIGRYEGIEQLDIQGIKKDYLTIRYKGEDKLYIPIDQMNMIQKYIGSDTLKPKISKLNSGEWQRTKSRAKRAVRDMAEDLIQLYAKRENVKGYPFNPDSQWQRQFEDLFPYEETEGQVLSASEIKKDMEVAKPMDRLLCGDVGYGKTEVALRAAFKALMDGKQVAILVPTTILAQQHYSTMVERFADFPIKTGILSRFRNQKEQKATIEGLRKGTLDIVVGTHRLLSKDVMFKDLGLLIIDEEQRFGVKHKEKLKILRENVDVLTLTATPIPRTLHMSLVGIRDMSVIEDPPAERYPIQTYVLEHNPQMIREAILKEISRGGQVYYVYNRVETIDKIALELMDLIPEAKFSIGHGQMGERQLEKVMMDFIEHKQDVLICTTIIETGLDIPNVNTIIVHDSDKMGLAQLYQLRGRVGRSTKVAYGYFTYEKGKVLTEVAEKRLRSIKEFTEFGSGYKIAMRDLEIRGAGSLLGLEQHGHIGSIGYDLYVKFLGEAIRKLKGESVVEEIETLIDINVDGYIPADFIEDEDLKLDIYKKIASISNIDDFRELVDELIDRFGDIPKVVENLMDVSYIKTLGSKNKIVSISNFNGGIKLDLSSNEDISLELIHLLTEKYGKDLSFNLSSNPYLHLLKNQDILKSLKEFMEIIDNFSPKEA